MNTNFAIHSLSPAFWYVVDAQQYAARNRAGLKIHGRCRVSPAFATKREAAAWIDRRPSSAGASRE